VPALSAANFGRSSGRVDDNRYGGSGSPVSRNLVTENWRESVRPGHAFKPRYLMKFCKPRHKWCHIWCETVALSDN